jgi:hypothetical protein
MALSQSDTAKFAMAVKNARPDITDEELSALVQEAGQVNDDPVKSQALAMKMLPQLNTQLADPYKDTGYTSADSMKQFDPAQMRAALAAQQAAYQQNQPSRAIGGILAGSSGSADVMNKNKADWEGIDAQNMLQSLGAQEKLQGQATAGINAAKGVQDMAQTAGKYAGTQLEAQQKLQGNQLSLEQQKRVNSPSSVETMIAKRMMASQLQSDPALAKDPQLKEMLARPDITAQMIMGFMDPKVLDAYKKQVGIAKEGAEAAMGQGAANTIVGTSTPVIGTPTAPQPQAATQPYQAGGGRGLHGAVGVNNVGNLTDPKTGQFRSFATPEEGRAALEADLRGKASKGLITVSDIITRYAPPSENNTGAYISAVAKALGVGPNDRLDMSNPTIMQKFTDAIIKQEGNTKLTSGAAPQQAQAQGQVQPMLKMQPGTNMSYQGSGVSITPSPNTTTAQTGAATDQETTRKQVTHYATTIADPAEKLLSVVRAGSGTGLGAKLPASWSNTNSDVAQKAINKIVAENAAMNGVAYNQADADTLFKAGPAVVADYVLNMKAEQGRRQLKLADQQQWQASHNGTLQEYNPGNLSQFKPMYNPVTGKVALIPEGSEEWNKRLKEKWFPSQTGYYMNKGK